MKKVVYVDKIIDYLTELKKESYTISIEAMIEMLQSVPAADVVNVVRCEKCRHWKRNVDITDSPNGYCFYNNEVMHKTEFCSSGDRKDEDEDE